MRFLIFLGIIFLCGCGTKKIIIEDVDVAEIELAEEGVSSVMPYRLDITDELNDGENLFLKISLENPAKYNINKTVLLINGLRKGKKVYSKYYRLNELVSSYEGNFIVEIPAKKLTDYSVDLLWGKEAKTFLDKLQKELYKNVELVNLGVEKSTKCSEKDCKVLFKLSGDIKNNNKEVLEYIDLMIGFASKKNINSKGIRKVRLTNTKIVNVSGLDLSPQASRSFSIKVKSPLVTRDQDLHPLIRIN